MDVRRIETGEGQRLRALRLDALREAPGAFRSRPELEEPFPADEWERRAQGVHVVEDDGEWLGMAGLYVDPDLPAVANVWGVWVDPRARGRGAGRALMEAAVARARADGHRRLELTLTDHSPAAAALYESLGFRRTGVTIGEEAVMALAFIPHVPIETERLRLRYTTPDDFGPLLELQGREDVTRWLPWGPRSEAQVRKSLAWKIAATTITTDGDSFTLAIERKDSGAYVGDIGLFATSHEHRGGELGYILHPDHHGQGFATEAARRMLEIGFTCFGMRRIVARLEPRNVASARVLEKLGMRREAHLVENEWLRGEWQSELVYAMLEAEWRAAQSQPRLRK